MTQLMSKNVLIGVPSLKEKMETLDHMASEESPEESKVH